MVANPFSYGGSQSQKHAYAYTAEDLLLAKASSLYFKGNAFKKCSWDFPGGQWLRLHTPSVQGAMGSIPGQGTKILHATWPGQKEVYFPKSFIVVK